jgi:hypothetical protein
MAPTAAGDLGAGSAVWSVALAQRSPYVRVTAVDWPDVIGIARKVTSRLGLSERYGFVAGDLGDAGFGADHAIAVLGHVLHSEGEARSRALLAKTFSALAPGGTIAIAEILVDASRTGPLAALIFAVNMLINTDRGDTFSLEEIDGWLRSVGFDHVRTVNAPGLAPRIVLATKPNADHARRPLSAALREPT